MAKLAAGELAPDMLVHDSTGGALRISELWRDSPLVLVFLRHFG
ncbi:MAG TPA: hypothetical protein VJ728_17520 [Candidatus Binataceae bacterium]|nr:hypothetical protein [Candidatus Binataceae bacterium]